MFTPQSGWLARSGGTLSRRMVQARSMASSSSRLSASGRVPVIKTLAELRAWRREKRDRKEDVGVVPTMGALHQGHLDLVKRSMKDNPFTVMTLFVNPMQFAPTEDLSRYPRTLQSDLQQLSTLLPPNTSPTPSITPSPSTSTTIDSTPDAALDAPTTIDPKDPSPLVVFAPATDEMYPLRGELQDLKNHKGVGVEMRGMGDVLEGASRPQFFKGVATVCTKLFNAVEPDHAYFGQKDIQQALLLKQMVADLLLAHPTPENLHILPTTRDPQTSLALSSRNAYLSPEELKVAPVLYRALSAAREVWENATSETRGEDIVAAAKEVVAAEQEGLGQAIDGAIGGGMLRMDYVEVFDRETFEPVRGKLEKGESVERKERGGGIGLVVAGAVWVGKTRLIDNVLLGWEVD